MCSPLVQCDGCERRVDVRDVLGSPGTGRFCLMCSLRERAPLWSSAMLARVLARNSARTPLTTVASRCGVMSLHALQRLVAGEANAAAPVTLHTADCVVTLGLRDPGLLNEVAPLSDDGAPLPYGSGEAHGWAAGL